MDFSQDCDSKDVILSALFTLVDFDDLVSARRVASVKKTQTLTDWVVFGRFLLDKDGQLYLYEKSPNRELPTVEFPDLPRLMTSAEFFQYVKDKTHDDTRGYFLTRFTLPPNNFFCPVCGEPWAISNCHDVVTNIQFEEIPLTDFIGKKLGDVREIWNKKTTEMWHLQPDGQIRNDRYVDHSIIDSDDGRAYHLEVNNEGIIKADDNHTIIHGDIARVNVWTFRHHKCDEKVSLAKLRERYENIFKNAGFQNIQMIETTQVFDGEDHLHNKPWVQVFADDIPFRIGLKNSVFEIRCNDYRIDFQLLFPSENVTKSTHFIHCWNSKQCSRILQKIRETLQ